MAKTTGEGSLRRDDIGLLAERAAVHDLTAGVIEGENRLSVGGDAGHTFEAETQPALNALGDALLIAVGQQGLERHGDGNDGF